MFAVKIVTPLAPFLLPAHTHINKIPQAFSSEKFLIIQLNSIHCKLKDLKEVIHNYRCAFPYERKVICMAD